MRVTDNAGATATARRSIQVTRSGPPPSVSFSSATAPGKLTPSVYTYSNTAPIRQVAWDLDSDEVYEDRVVDFDRGSYAESRRVHAPAPPPGEYEVGVRVTDDSGPVDDAAAQRHDQRLRAAHAARSPRTAPSTAAARGRERVDLDVELRGRALQPGTSTTTAQFDDATGYYVYADLRAGRAATSVRVRADERVRQRGRPRAW